MMQQLHLRRLLKFAHRVYAFRYRFDRSTNLGVRILLVKEDRVVLVKHTYQDLWYLPGGRVEHRETPTQAAIRETDEEVGAIIHGPIELMGVYSNFIEGKNDHIILLIATNFAMSTRKEQLEIEAFDLFRLTALPADVSPATRRRIEEYLRQERGVVAMW